MTNNILVYTINHSIVFDRNTLLTKNSTRYHATDSGYAVFYICNKFYGHTNENVGNLFYQFVYVSLKQQHFISVQMSLYDGHLESS